MSKNHLIIGLGETDENVLSELRKRIFENSHASDDVAMPEHSRKLLSFGMKKLEYPETEIREYVAFHFARQAARQMLFNVWRVGVGFDECANEEAGLDFKFEIQSAVTRKKLLLSDQYLTLSSPIIEHETTGKWKGIAEFWNFTTQTFAEELQTEDKKNWMSDFTRKCGLQYDNHYRGVGVNEFYERQRSEIKTYSVHIRRHIEHKLFLEWYKGEKSIIEIEKYVAQLIEDCEARFGKFEERITEFETRRDQTVIPEIRRCTMEWYKIGRMKDIITDVSTKIFSTYQVAMCEYYTHQTQIAGYLYAIELMQMIRTELVNMLKQIESFKSLFTTALEHFDAQAGLRCRQPAEDEKSADKIYDPNLVRAITGQFTADEWQQKKNAGEIRSKLVKLLGEDDENTFNDLYERLDSDRLEDIFMPVCAANATAMMETLARTDKNQKIIHVHILEKIKREYSTDELLEELIRKLVHSAQSNLSLNQTEAERQIRGENQGMTRMIYLILPEYNDPDHFRQKFISIFKKVVPNFDLADDLSVSNQQNRIMVIAVDAGFPLRSVSRETFLFKNLF